MEFKGVGQQQPGIQRVQVPSSHRAGAASAPVPAGAPERQGDSFLPSGNSQPVWLGVGTLGSAVSTDKPGALNNLFEAAAKRLHSSSFNTSA
jgi:hypothetical protein